MDHIKAGAYRYYVADCKGLESKHSPVWYIHNMRHMDLHLSYCRFFGTFLGRVTICRQAALVYSAGPRPVNKRH
jgi:hypothetical protein